MTFRFRTGIGGHQVSVTDNSSATQAMRVTQQAMADVVREFERFFDEVPRTAADSIYEAMRPVKERADVLCPFKTGRLRASGYLEVTSRGPQPRIEIGYGRDNEPPYAPIVHEDLQSYHEPPTQAKWLETALREHQQDIPLRIAESIRSGTGLKG